MQINKLNLLFLIVIIISSVSLTSCGGGTNGTGGGGVRVKGLVADKTLKTPVRDLSVKIKDSDNETVTDINGRFEITSFKSYQETIELIFENEDETIILEIQGVPEDAKEIDLVLSFDGDLDEIVIDNIDFESETISDETEFIED